MNGDWCLPSLGMRGFGFRVRSKISDGRTSTGSTTASRFMSQRLSTTLVVVDERFRFSRNCGRTWSGPIVSERLGRSAGVPQWQKTFVNLRASRSDELDRTLPPHVVDSWMGHSGKVRRAHYLMVTEQDFANASSQIPEKAQKAARAAHVRGHQQPSDASETREKQRGGQEEEVPEYPRQGSNL